MSVLVFSGLTWFYLGLRVHFSSYEWTQRFCLVFDVSLHPNSHVNCTEGEEAIFRRLFVASAGLHLSLPNWPVSTTEPTKQRTKKFSRGSCLVSLVIFYDFSSNKLPVKFWFHELLIWHLVCKINRSPSYYLIWMLQHMVSINAQTALNKDLSQLQRKTKTKTKKKHNDRKKNLLKMILSEKVG